MKKEPKVTPEQWVEIIQAYREGAHVPTLAKKHGITPGYIYRFVSVLNERGIKVERTKIRRNSVVNKFIELSQWTN